MNRLYVVIFLHTRRHGIFHRLTVWADGPSMITQCPIQPAGHRYAYRFNITGQEGTLWWHAHSSFLRATVYGAIIIRPKSGHSYPFPKPHKEVPIIFGMSQLNNLFLFNCYQNTYSNS